MLHRFCRKNLQDTVLWGESLSLFRTEILEIKSIGSLNQLKYMIETLEIYK